LRHLFIFIMYFNNLFQTRAFIFEQLVILFKLFNPLWFILFGFYSSVLPFVLLRQKNGSNFNFGISHFVTEWPNGEFVGLFLLAHSVLTTKLPK
jgi:hypothetical protein